MAAVRNGFEELASGLFWKPGDRILMLWAYFDESGEHLPPDQGGHLTHLTLGGCVADVDDWRKLSSEWLIALDEAQVPHFHMVDFEARKGVFSGWCEKRRERLLNALLDSMGRHVSRFVGFVITPEDAACNTGDWHRFDGTRGALQALVYHSASRIQERYEVPTGERISLVYAKHCEMRQAYYDKVMAAIVPEDFELIEGLTINRPESVPPLQAADIWAYELARWQRPNRPERYPAKRIREFGRTPKLFYVAGGVPAFYAPFRKFP